MAKRVKGTAEYEEWLRKYREKRGKKVEEQVSSTIRQQEFDFGDSAPERVSILPKGTKRMVHSKSQNKDLSIEVIRFIPTAGKYLCSREDGKFLYYSEKDMSPVVAIKTPAKATQVYTNSKKDSVSIVPDGTMSKRIEDHVNPIISAMSFEGFKIDKEELAKVRAEAEATLEAHKKELFDAAGGEFNFNAPNATAELLYDKLGLPQIDGRSTAAEVLEKLAGMTESKVPQLISQVRSDRKMITSYIDKLEKLANRGDGYLRNQFSSATVSGRLSTQFNPAVVEVPDEVEVDESKVYFPEDLAEIGMNSICPL